MSEQQLSVSQQNKTFLLKNSVDRQFIRRCFTTKMKELSLRKDFFKTFLKRNNKCIYLQIL